MSSSSPIRRLATHLEQHPHLALGGILTLIVLIVYAPALDAYFISDDFSHVNLIASNLTAIFQGREWDVWLILGIHGGSYFRPFGQGLLLFYYLVSDQNPLGYHLINAIFHILSAFLIYLLAWLMLKRRTPAVMAAILFAVLPIHAAIISWFSVFYDVLAGFFVLGTTVFYVLYLHKGKNRFLFMAIGAFVLGITSKETAIPLPPILLAYEILFEAKRLVPVSRLVARQLPFWLIVGLRLALAGHGHHDLQMIPEGWGHWADLNLSYAVDPFSFDMLGGRLVLVGVAILLLLLWRPWRPVAFAWIWMLATSAPTLTSGPSDRSFYIPSIGLCLVMGIILAALVEQPRRSLKLVGATAFAGLVLAYSASLVSRNQLYYRAGQVAQVIPEQVKALHPTLPPDARLVFVGVPDRIPDGLLVFLTGLPAAIALNYPSQYVAVFKYDAFPIWFDKLDSTFFFQVDHRRVTERADLVQVLKKRQECSATPAPLQVWDFSHSVQGWEAWNQLDDPQIRDGAMTTRAWGNDPFLASPLIDFAAFSLDGVSIEMSAQADQPTLNGELFWRGAGQPDFSPGLMEPFVIQADGAFHTYSINLLRSGKFLLGDRITQFRLNPSDRPADLSIRSIRVLTRCSASSQAASALGDCQCIQ